MAKLIKLIDLDEIKTLRVTCEKCHAYWSIPVSSGENKLPRKCNCSSDAVITRNQLEHIEGLLKKIKDIQQHLKYFKISIESELED